MLPIRANANTTINENNPSSARELLAYYNREQYGDANVFYGSYYSETGERDKNDPYEDAKPKYEKDEAKQANMLLLIITRTPCPIIQQAQRFYSQNG